MRNTLLGLILLSITHSALAVDWLEAAKELTEPEPEQTLQTENSSDATANIGSLTSLISSGLGVSDAQATGGLGSLFSLAQNTLGGSDFSSLSNYVPDMGSYLDAVPSVTSNSGGLLNSLGGLGETASATSDVYSQFSSLGLGAEHIPQYIKIINDYLQSSGGQQAVELFQTGISSLL